jgi:hypothetical protein
VKKPSPQRDAPQRIRTGQADAEKGNGDGQHAAANEPIRFSQFERRRFQLNEWNRNHLMTRPNPWQISCGAYRSRPAESQRETVGRAKARIVSTAGTNTKDSGHVAARIRWRQSRTGNVTWHSSCSIGTDREIDCPRTDQKRKRRKLISIWSLTWHRIGIEPTTRIRSSLGQICV